ncbi:SDR family NAD(P)-dependent oxidoreductase [candidate division KSB1 bacterium]|nr:SDR family NAD(P)-dependent oxidoreductase [candidate division KSB1 bacterium]
MKDRICLITGATSGVGRATALGAAKLGATVILLSRNKDKGAFVRDEIKKKSANGNIYSRVLNLADLDEIHRFADQFKHEFKALHVLSNNAALLMPRKELTEAGIEKMFAVNYLSHFLLTNLLLDLLKSSAPSRILTVSGDPLMLKFGKLDLDDINLEKNFNPIRATYRAAIAKVAFSHELAKRLKGTGVTSNTFHPGLVKSNLTDNLPRFISFFVRIGQAFFSEDCKTSVYLATSPEVEKISGAFFKNKKPVLYKPVHPLDDYSEKLWQKSEELVGLS